MGARGRREAGALVKGYTPSPIPLPMDLIDGVAAKPLRMILDERGWLMEIMRTDWEISDPLAQVYVTTAHPQVVKAWHLHHKQTDHMACIRGTVKLVLYDSRADSTTKGKINEFVMGERNPMVVRVPPYVWHGFKNVGEEQAFVINVVDHLYDYKDPDEFRAPPDTRDIPYDWRLAPWLKHG